MSNDLNMILIKSQDCHFVVCNFFDTYMQDSSISSPGSCHPDKAQAQIGDLTNSISQPVITWYCRSNGKSQEIEWKGNLKPSNVGEPIINHPPNHHFYRWREPFPNGWFMTWFDPH